MFVLKRASLCCRGMLEPEHTVYILQAASTEYEMISAFLSRFGIF